MFLQELLDRDIVIIFVPKIIKVVNIREAYTLKDQLCDKLPLDVIRAPTLCDFKTKTRRIFAPFNEKLS